MVLENLDKYKNTLKLSLSSYYPNLESSKIKKEDASLKKNENELMKKISEYLVKIKIKRV